MSPFAISVVIPVHNEAGNVARLHEELIAVLESLGEPFEIVFVNDASTDRTLEELERLSSVRVLDLAAHSGQAAALKAGFDSTDADIVVSLDGDGQNDPRDIPHLLARLAEGYDAICGWRRPRQGSWLTVLTSRIGSWLQRRLFKLPIHDSGCTLRAYRRWALNDLQLFGELHRCLPALLQMRGARLSEIEIVDRLRTSGKTKYGFFKLLRGFSDLLLIWLWQRHAPRPGHLLFAGAIVAFVVGGGLLAAMLVGPDRGASTLGLAALISLAPWPCS